MCYYCRSVGLNHVGNIIGGKNTNVSVNGGRAVCGPSPWWARQLELQIRDKAYLVPFFGASKGLSTVPKKSDVGCAGPAEGFGFCLFVFCCGRLMSIGGVDSLNAVVFEC